MKATTIILATVLTLQAGILFAENDRFSTTSATENSTITLASVAPATPMEATFEDYTAISEMTGLIPAMPAEATFEDFAEVHEFADLAPLTPIAADFGDAINSATIDNGVLAPVTPNEADFE